MFKKLFMLLVFLPSFVFAAEFVAGKDYQLIPGTEKLTSKATVLEFFSYGCPWCYRLEGSLEQWKKVNGKTVDFQRIPVVFHQDWENYAKAYYTAEALKIADKMTPLLFKAIQDDKKNLSQRQAMIDFFVAQGVANDVVKSAFEYSPTIDLDVKNGMAKMAGYQINAVPAFVINNHYKTDMQMAQGPERLFKLINYLMTNP